MSTLLFSAFTDFKWVLTGLREEGDSVIMSGHFEGKHTGDLDLSSMGMGVIPASGKMIGWPQASVEFKFEGDKVVSERPYGDTSGIEAFFEPLGVKLPTA
jgi:predicted ester cyclase